MNASVHIAKLNAPRANGIGALPSQHTGSQPGAVKRRASQIFAKYRSASTGGADDSSSSVRVRWPEPPQMSMARRAAAEHRAAPTARDHRLRRRCRSDRRSGRGNSRPRSSARAPRRFPGTSRCRMRRPRRTRARLRVVVEAEHRAARQIRPARFESDRARRSAAGSRCRTGMPSTTGKMQHWQPRMPSWISSPLRRWNSDVDQVEPAAAVRAAQDVERLNLRHVRCDLGSPSCSSSESPACRSSGARRKCSTPSQRRASSSSSQAIGLFGAHLGPVAAQRGELARHPVAHVDDEASAAWRRRRTRRARCPRSSSPAARRPWRAPLRRPRA